MLLIHILSSVIGISGSYIKFLSKKDRVSKIGMYTTIFGLFFVTISGIFLFKNDPQKFLESGKFLSNMTVMIFLIIIEVSDYFKKIPDITKKLSVFSWTWIFLVALIHPKLDYLVFMILYFLIISLFFKKYLRQKNTKML